MRLLFRYIKNLGLAKGLGNWIAVELRAKGKVKPKGVRTSVELRPNTTDYKVFREIFLFRDYDFPIDKPGVIIDAGANVGYASVFFANAYPSSRIIAIEPEEENFSMLKKNTAAYPGIDCLKGALMSQEGTYSIVDKAEAEWSYQVKQDTTGPIQGFTVDSLLSSNNLGRINLLKIDIEGAEADLFSSNTDQWLSRVDQIIIELHDWINPKSSQTFFYSLVEFEYTTRIINGMVYLKLSGKKS